jgi:hypothetical protein
MSLKVLSGHTTAETAYVVADYPYGFRLRCKIRYWLERVPKKGYRLCSQTTNPKIDREVWNTPKKSTYTMLGVMGLDGDDHVSWTGISPYDLSKLEAFGVEYAEHFDEHQARDFADMLRLYQAYQRAVDRKGSVIP